MTNYSSLLFVYGTLLLKNNEFGRQLQSRCKALNKGRIKGTLYDVGEYPGVVINYSAGYIHGHIYSMNKPDEVLPVLDEYEGISTNDPQPHEYARVLMQVETDDGLLNCWVYIYNWPVDNLKRIDSGDYLAYLGHSS